MLVHFVEPEWNETICGYDYEHYKVLSARTVESYDKFIKFIKAMKGCHIEIKDVWYEVEDICYSFPMDHDYEPVLRIYVTEAY